MVFSTIPYGLPCLGALAVKLLGERRERVQYPLATALFALTGVVTLVVLLLAPGNLVIGGISAITAGITALLSFVLAGHLIAGRRYGLARRPGFYALLLVLIGGLNGVALARTTPVMFISWGLVAFAVIKLLWYGGVVGDVSADKRERRKRGRDDF